MKRNTERNNEHNTETVYADAFSFVIGRIDNIRSLHSKHNGINNTLVNDMYSLAEITCRKVLKRRHDAINELDLFIANQLAKSNEAPDHKDGTISPATATEIESLCYEFVWSKIGKAELKARYKWLCSAANASPIEQSAVELLQRCRRRIVRETAIMLERCDALATSTARI